MDHHQSTAPEGRIEVNVNGEQMSCQQANLTALINSLGHARTQGIALAVNNRVVPRSGWDAYELKQGDSVTLIRAAAGG